jgi:hypothetical protein
MVQSYGAAVVPASTFYPHFVKKSVDKPAIFADFF